MRSDGQLEKGSKRNPGLLLLRQSRWVRRRQSTLLTASYDGTAKLWCLRSGRCLRTFATK
ncbi:unnamed protein product, partial [Polarella glacialis]